jgi:hypothetical protein
MHHAPSSLRTLLLPAALVVWGCQASLSVSVPGGEQRARAVRPAARLTEVSGAIRLPARLVGPDAGTLVGVDAGSLVGLDAGTLVGVDAGTLAARGPLSRKVLAAEAGGQPLVGVRVYLADARGKALVGLPEAWTDAGGRFSLRGVPPGLTYIVVAEAPTRAGKVARLTSLASTHAGAAEVVIGLGSTMLTAALVADSNRGLGRVSNVQMRETAAQLERKIDLARLPDLTDPGAVTRAAQAMVADDATVQQELAPLKAELNEAPVTPAAAAALVAAELAADRNPQPVLPGSGESLPATPAPSAGTQAPPDPASASDPAPATTVPPEGAGPTALPPSEVTPTPTPAPPGTDAPTATPTPTPGTVATPTPAPTPTPTPAPTSPPAEDVRTLRFGIDTLAGSPKLATSLDGAYAEAGFSQPFGIGVVGPGVLLVSQPVSGGLRLLDGRSVRTLPLTTIASPLAVLGVGTGEVHVSSKVAEGVFTVGVAAVDAKLSSQGIRDPQGLARDGAGGLYVSSRQDNKIMKAVGGAVTLHAGHGAADHLDGAWAEAKFAEPKGLAWSAKAGLYVADMRNHCIRLVGLDGRVTTVAGTRRQAGALDGVGTAAQFSSPTGLALDSNGILYVADTGNHRIRAMGPDGTVVTVAGNGQAGWVDDPLSAAKAQLSSPSGVAVSADGRELYVTDTANNCIRILKRLD